jgi:2-oxo-4-hydroxy-4-carboxy-5-ureidoimidazoline decarboxylase
VTDSGGAVAKAGCVTLAALNRASREEFTAALGAVFEHSPWVAAAAWPAAPFAKVAHLHAAMIAAVRAALEEQRLTLIQAHPDLAGNAARSGTMTAASAAEQGSAGLLDLSDAEFERFQRLNAAYRERFGFPFILAVRRHDKTSLLAAFERRLGHSREEEIAAALAEIFAIAALRLEALLGGEG